MKITITGRCREIGMCYDEACGGETNEAVIESDDGATFRVVGFAAGRSLGPLYGQRVTLTIEVA